MPPEDRAREVIRIATSLHQRLLIDVSSTTADPDEQFALVSGVIALMLQRAVRAFANPQAWLTAVIRTAVQ